MFGNGGHSTESRRSGALSTLPAAQGAGSISYVKTANDGCDVGYATSGCVTPGYNFIYDAFGTIMFSSSATDASLNCPTVAGTATGTTASGTMTLSVVAGSGSGTSVSASYTATSFTFSSGGCNPVWTRGLASPNSQIGTLTATSNPGNDVCARSGYYWLSDAANNIGFVAMDSNQAHNCPWVFGLFTATTTTSGTINIVASAQTSVVGIPATVTNLAETPTATTGTLTLSSLGPLVYSIAGLAVAAPVAVSTTLTGLNSTQSSQLVSGSGAAYTAAVNGIAASVGLPASGVAVTFSPNSGGGVTANVALTTTTNSAAALQTAAAAVTPATMASSIATAGLTGVTTTAPVVTKAPAAAPTSGAERVAAFGSALLALVALAV